MKLINKSRLLEIVHSLRMQLIIYLVLISFIVLAIGAYSSYTYVLDMLKKNNESYLLQEFRQAEYNIQNVFNNVDRLSGLFTLNDSIQEFTEKENNGYDIDQYILQTAIFKLFSQLQLNYTYINSIYIFNEGLYGMGGSSSNSKTFSGNEDYSNFVSKKIYAQAQETFPKKIFFGGIKEEFANENLSNNYSYDISLLVGVKSYRKSGDVSALIFNIDERYIASIYSKPGSLDKRKMFIVDETGKVISAENYNSIGSSYKIIDNIDHKKDYGSLTVNSTTKPFQVVYYKMKDLDWYLVEEVPLEYFLKDIISLQRIIFAVFVFSFIMILIVSYFWLRKLTRPLQIIASKMRDMGKGNLGLTFKVIPKNEFGILIRRFNEMSINIVELISKNNAITEEKKELEIDALRAQINPHFLYNTLNMIRWMAVSVKAKEVAESIIALGNIIKPAFKNTDPMCNLYEELQYLSNYIKILNWRFGDNVFCIFDIDEKFMGNKIFKFMLQPIVENSVIHGIKKQEDIINIKITGYEVEGKFLLIVTDNGKGMNDTQLEVLRNNLKDISINKKEKTLQSIGLHNVNRRIVISFGETYGIEINSSENIGTVVTVTIPIIH